MSNRECEGDFMETLLLMGYEKLETLYNSPRTSVCRARDKSGDTVLLKVLKTDQPTIEQLARLEYEYALMNTRELQSIVKVRELVRHYKGHVLVMEDNGGTPLLDAPIVRSIRRQSGLQTTEQLRWLLKIFIEMTEALRQIHELRLVHLDINPSNFLLFPSGNRVAVMDFGRANNQDRLAMFSTQQELEGDLMYISPEQTGRVDRIPDYRSDFYALGATMYDLITGKRPFASAGTPEVIHRHIAENPTPPHELAQAIPVMVSAIIMKLMKKAPEERYRSEAGIRYDLEKCLESLDATGSSQLFELGRADTSSKFQIPKRMYGREADRMKLKQMYVRVSNGPAQVLLVSGSAGVGKTSLIQEVCHPLAVQDGFFARGKAEQFQRSTPYHVFIQAAKDLAVALLQEPDSQLELWKENLLKALKENGRLITDLVPELAAVMGPQPQVPELGQPESKNRFLNTIAGFFGTFAWKGHPLTLFLDDLQWCDRPSLELLLYLLSRADLESFAIIGCYRDDELSDTHPLLPLVGELMKSKEAQHLHLQPLEEGHIARMLADIFSQTDEDVSPLAGAVFRLTHGNPFYLKKILNHLSNRRFLWFDFNSQRWAWDITAIAALGVSDNIVEFMITQIKTFSADTQAMLKLAALAGSTCDMKVLASASGVTAAQVASRLREAVEREILLLEEGDLALARLMQGAEQSGSLRFAHDRIQQACVELMDNEQRQTLRLVLGRTIKAQIPKDEWPERAMDIVCHFNEALEGIVNEEERWDTIRLNLWAAQKAKKSSAFYSALGFIKNSTLLLPEDAWKGEYELVFSIHRIYCECALLNSDYTLAEEQVQLLLLKAKTTEEQAEIRLTQSTLMNFQGLLDQAIKYACLGLELLKVRAPATLGLPRVLAELAIVRARLAGKNRERLLSLPLMKNERMKLALQLWNEINRASYLVGNTNLFLLSILKQMLLTLHYGRTRDTGKTFISYAMILAVFGNYKGTEDYCELARLSCLQDGSMESQSTILFSSGFFGHAWNRSWREIDTWLERSMAEAIKYGDHHTIAIAGAFMYAFKPDASIKLLSEKAMKQLPLVVQTDNRLAFNLIFLMINRRLAYAGLTDNRLSMTISRKSFEKNGGYGVVFSEEECIKAMDEGNFTSAFGVYYNEKANLHYVFDDYNEALAHLKKSDRYVQNHEGTPYIVECRRCAFLVLAANIQGLSEQEAQKAHRRLKKEYGHMKTWAKHCATNFLHLQYLMEAELARLEGKIYEASALYDKAIETAKLNGFTRDEALANELAGKMLLQQGRERQALYYLTEAVKTYRLWGADAKVDQLQEKYSGVLEEKVTDLTHLPLVTNAGSLDLLSLIKTSQAVSEEACIPDLLYQIMKIVIENSGAEKACILLKSETGWRLEAQWIPGGRVPQAFQTIPLSEMSGLLPESVINYCIRAGTEVVLADASGSDKFFKDSYIRQHEIRSLLCMPVLNQGNFEGILYLENNLSTGVFTEERVRILQLLAAQFLNSVKNVRLFTELLSKTEEIHQAEEEVLRSDIAFLQAQIKPHFLFNAINTISACSLDDAQMTRDLLAKLSQYLRGSFDFKNRDNLIPLHKELELVDAYLSLEKARYGDRLRVIYNVDDQIDCVLPPLVLQPLVENAVQHGLAGLKMGGTVQIAVQRDKDGGIVMAVEDDGVGIDETIINSLTEGGVGDSRGGVALRNIQNRLTRQYGRGMEIERKASGGTRITIHLAIQNT